MAVLARDSVTLATINDLKRASVYYKLQSSNLTPPTTPSEYPPASGSGWVTIEPGYITGSTDTLYIIHVMEFSNGDYDYLPVQKSSSYEAAKQAYNAAVAASKAASSADGKTTIETRPPTAQDAAGKPEGASWEVTNGTFITQRYVLSNGTWVQTKVGSDYIGDNAIGTAHIIDASIDSAKVKDLAVTKLVAKESVMDEAAVRQIIGDAATFRAINAQTIDLDSLEAAKFIAVGGVNQISRNELTQDLNQSLDDVASDLGALASSKADVSVTDGLTEKVDSVEGSLTNQILEVASGLESANTTFTEYTTRLDQRIVIDDTGITISQAGSDFAVRITNDRMAFLQGSSEVAYMSNSKMYITDTEVLNSLVLGKFSFEPRANGNLSFKYGA